MWYLKPKVSSSLNFGSLFSVMRYNCSVLFSWNFVSFGQKESINMQNFRLLTAHVKFYQICALVGSFYWKYIKFQLKKYKVFMSHDPEGWCKIWKKTDLLFQKWQKFGEIRLEHSKVFKMCTSMGSFWAKYTIFELKKYRRFIFHDTEEWDKIWRKSYLLFGKWPEAFSKFSPDYSKVSKVGL